MKEKALEGAPLLLYYLSIFVLSLGFIMLIPLTMLVFYPEEASEASCFLIPSAICIATGYVPYFCLRGRKVMHLKNHQDAILVVLVWAVLIALSTLPFMFKGGYTWSEAVFEITSGYTTTGMTVVDVAATSHMFLFYRTITLYIGGVGFVLVLTSALSDKLELNVYEAEGHSDKLLPNLAKSARLIFALYTGYILLGTIMYLCCGMDLFDAFNHAVAGVSTGGFSTRPNSIYEYHSIAIDVVSVFLMLAGSTNFFVHLCLLRGKFKGFFLHSETLFCFFLLVATVGMGWLGLSLSGFDHERGALDVAMFQFVSALTTTGFQNVESMDVLPNFFRGAMIVLMLIGGGIGSTAGGMKQYRIVLALKGIKEFFAGGLNHKLVVHHSYVRKADHRIMVDEKMHLENFAFLGTYIGIFLIGTFIFTCFGYDVQDSAFEFSSCLSTVGLSVGIVHKGAHPFILWTGTLGMFCGRLEIFVVYAALAQVCKNIKGGVLTCLKKQKRY